MDTSSSSATRRGGRWPPFVRDLDHVLDAHELRSNENWVGAVTWRALLPDLRALPVTEPWDRDWLSLLEVAESDGDFDQGIPTRPEVEAQRDLLGAISPLVFDHLVNELRSKYRGSADPAIRGLHARPVTQDGVWAGFVIRGAEDGAWLYIAIRNLFADHPRLRIDYYTFDDWRARRRLSDAYARIVKRGFKHVNNYYRFDTACGAAQGRKRRQSRRCDRRPLRAPVRAGPGEGLRRRDREAGARPAPPEVLTGSLANVRQLAARSVGEPERARVAVLAARLRSP